MPDCRHTEVYGVEMLHFTYEVSGGDMAGAGEASASMKQALRKMGFDSDTIRRVAVCMYEGEINMVIHANGGTACVDVGEGEITIVLRDQGPGIPDIEQAMQAGFTTAGEAARDLGFGAGMGLPNMKKYSDQMTVESTVGVGTTVTMVVRIPADS